MVRKTYKAVAVYFKNEEYNSLLKSCVEDKKTVTQLIIESLTKCKKIEEDVARKYFSEPSKKTLQKKEKIILKEKKRKEKQL